MKNNLAPFLPRFALFTFILLLNFQGAISQSNQYRYYVKPIAGGKKPKDTVEAFKYNIGNANFFTSLIAKNSKGEIIFTNGENNTINKLDSNGFVIRISGDGVSSNTNENGVYSKLRSNGFINGLTVDRNDNILFNENGRIYKIDKNNIISKLAGGGLGPLTDLSKKAQDNYLGSSIRNIKADNKGNIYLIKEIRNLLKIDSTGNIVNILGTNAPSNLRADSISIVPNEVAIGKSGNIYFADNNSHVIRKINQDGLITTIAGTPGVPGFTGDGGPAINALINGPRGITVDNEENIYFSGNYRIRKISKEGIISTIAGNGTNGNSGDNGNALNATLGDIRNIIIDNNKNIYYSDIQYHVIKRISNGIITTIAGSGVSGFSGDGGPATSAQFSSPQGIAFNKDGELLIADRNNRRIRKINKSGIIVTYAGNGTSSQGAENIKAYLTGVTPKDIVIDSLNNIYLIEDTYNKIKLINKDTIISTFAGTGTSGFSGDGGNAINSNIRNPQYLSIDNNNLYITTGDYRIRKINRINNVITTIAGNGFIASCPDGASKYCQFSNLRYYAVQKDNSIIFYESNESKIKRLSLDGKITSIAGNGTPGYSGDGGLAINASIFTSFIDVDTIGNIYFSDYSNHRIRKIDTEGKINTILGNGTQDYAGDEVIASELKPVNNPQGLLADNSGNLYFWENFYLRKIDKNKNLTTLIGSGKKASTIPYDFNTKIPSNEIVITSNVRGIVSDTLDNIYFLNGDNFKLMSIKNGFVEVHAGGDDFSRDDGNRESTGIQNPSLLTIDKTGNLYFTANSNTNGSRIIKKLDKNSNSFSKIAGGNTSIENSENLALNASFRYSIINGLSIDTSGKVLVHEFNRIRKLNGNGTISTIAGPAPPSTSTGFTGDGGPATNALFGNNYNSDLITVDKSNNIFLADESNNRIRKISNNGIVSTIAGNGTQGYSGDGGNAINAQLTLPSKIAIDSKGNIYFFQYSNNGIVLRKIDTSGIINSIKPSGGGLNSVKLSNNEISYFNSPNNIYINNKDEILYADERSINKIILSNQIISPPYIVKVSSEKNNILISWNAQNIQNLKFQVFRSSANSDDSKILIADDLSGDKLIDSSILKLNGIYKNPIIKYWVRAYNNEEIFSDLSLEQKLLMPPTIDSIKAANKLNLINWNYLSQDSIKYFKIFRDTIINPTKLLDSVNSSTLSYKDTSKLLLNKKYYYRLVAGIDINTESPFSDTISATPFNINPRATKIKDTSFTSTGEFNFRKVVNSSTSSIDLDGKIVSRKWYVNNVLVNSTDSIFSYNFPQGTSELKLIIEDNDGAKDSSVSKINVLAFSKNFNGGIKSGISASGRNSIFIADSTYDINSGGAIYKLDRLGNINLKLSVNFRVLNTPSVSFDSSILVTSGSNLNGFNKSGGPLWPTIPLGSTTSVTPTVDSSLNRLYIGVTNKNFFAFDIKTGKLNWMYTCESPINSSAIITGNRRLVFFSQSGILHGFDLTKDSSIMNPKWRINLGDTVLKSAAVDLESNIYFGTTKGNVIKMRLNNDSSVTNLWTTKLTDSVESSPVIDSRGFIYVGTNKGNLNKLSPVDGKVIWTYKSGSAIKSTPAITNFGTIVFANMKGEVLSLDTSMNLKWKYLSNSPITSNILYVDNMIYAGTDSGGYFGIYDNPSTSTVSSELNSEYTSLSTVKNNLSIIENSQSIQSSSSSLSEPIWGTFQGNFRRSGAQKIECPDKPTISSSRTDLSFCEGDSLKLTTSASNDKISWFSKSGTIKNVSSSSLTVNKTEDIFLTRTNLYGCTVNSDTISIKSKPIPPSPSISRDASGNLLSSIQSDIVSWYKDNSKVKDSALSFKPTTSGYYSAKINVNGCESKMSANYYYIVSAVSNLNTGSNIRIVPNPTKGRITFLNDNSQKMLFQIEIFSNDGKSLLKYNNVINGQEIDLSSIGAGPFILSINEKGKANKTIIKMIKY